MDVTSIAALATSMSAAKLGDDVATSVLKKSLDLQKAAAARLLEALPPVPTPDPSGRVGSNVDTRA